MKRASISPVMMAITVTLGACSDRAVVEQRFQARQDAVDRPELWLAEALAPDGAVAGQVFICANLGLREGFTRADIVADGDRTCLVQGSPMERSNSYAARCNIGYDRYALNVHTEGDTRNDMRVRVTLQPTDRQASAITQTRRYRRMGACPAGWEIGDQARPGRPPQGNALATE